MLSGSLIRALALVTLLPNIALAAAVPGNVDLATTASSSPSALHDTFEDNKSVPPGPRGRPPVDKRREDRVFDSSVVGEPHGTAFNDANMGSQHKRIHSITVSGCEPGSHLSYIGMTYRSQEGVESKVSHGKAYINAVPKTMDLTYGERVVTVALTTWRKKVGYTRRTRVGWIKFVTNLGNTLICGGMAESDIPQLWWSQGNDLALLYLSGSSGDEIDALQGHSIPMRDY